VFYYIALLVALSSGMAPLKVAVEQLAGSTMGVALGLSGVRRLAGLLVAGSAARGDC